MFKCQMHRPGKMVGIAFAAYLFGMAFNAGASDLSYWITSISHDADTAMNYTHDAVKIMTAGQYVHCIWPGMQSQYNTGNPGVLFYRRSHDNGLTFDQPQIIASAYGAVRHSVRCPMEQFGRGFFLRLSFLHGLDHGKLCHGISRFHG